MLFFVTGKIRAYRDGKTDVFDDARLVDAEDTWGARMKYERHWLDRGIFDSYSVIECIVAETIR